MHVGPLDDDIKTAGMEATKRGKIFAKEHPEQSPSTTLMVKQYKQAQNRSFVVWVHNLYLYNFVADDENVFEELKVKVTDIEESERTILYPQWEETKETWWKEYGYK